VLELRDRVRPSAQVLREPVVLYPGEHTRVGLRPDPVVLRPAQPPGKVNLGESSQQFQRSQRHT
jgi:hypothetical protein